MNRRISVSFSFYDRDLVCLEFDDVAQAGQACAGPGWASARRSGPSRTKVSSAGRASKSANRMVSVCRWDAADLRSEARGTGLLALQEAGQCAVDVDFPVSTAVSIQSRVARRGQRSHGR